MATLPTRVDPGDIISSDLMNAILNRLDQLTQGEAPAGTQTVPNVFGAFLADARSLINAPSRQLTMGFVIDVSGTGIDPGAADNANRVVLNQHPGAGTRVSPRTPVNLVVSRAATASGTVPVPQPAIFGTETLDGSASTTFRVNQSFVLVGENFHVDASENRVRFNDEPAARVSRASGSRTRRLIVQVPTGIPSAPSEPGDSSQLEGVVVSLTVGDSDPATTEITVTAPIGDELDITGVEPRVQMEGLNVTIEGANFVPGRTQVEIGGEDAAIVDDSQTDAIIVTVPLNIPGVESEISAPVPVRVRVFNADGTEDQSQVFNNFRVYGR